MLNKFSKHSSLDLTINSQAAWVENKIKKFFIQSWGTRTGSSLMQDKEHIIKEGQWIPDAYKGQKLGLYFGEETITRENYGSYALEDLKVFFNEKTGFEYVQCIDLSEWVFKNLNKENYNVLKIDIEGAEYKVIDHLLKTGAHEYIDEWLVEFTHKSRAPESFSQETVDRFKSVVSNYTDWGPMGDIIMEGDRVKEIIR